VPASIDASVSGALLTMAIVVVSVAKAQS
jgi:hypothetical protein